MQRTKLIGQLFLFHVFILIAVISSLLWFGVYSLHAFYVEAQQEALTRQTTLIGARLTEIHQVAGWYQSMHTYCRQASQLAALRITLVSQTGTVLCDSEKNVQRMENHANRPEIHTALQGNTGYSQRFSTSIGQDLLYVALPIWSNQEIIGAVRTAISLPALEKMLQPLFIEIGTNILIITLLGILMILVVSRRISSPLAIIRQGAARFAAGHFETKISLSGPEEVVSLAHALNQMATLLSDRIQEATTRNHELETILSSMAEGVIALSRDGTILHINAAACQQLDIHAPPHRGKNILELVRNQDFIQVHEQTLQQMAPLSTTIRYPGKQRQTKIFRIHSTHLLNGIPTPRGSVLLVSDMTRLKQLENIRSDFVANVSHQLKTPITSIKGYIETLTDEANHLPSPVRAFPAIILRHANKLQSIVEDLLTLSRIEDEKNYKKIDRTPVSIRQLINTAIEICESTAKQKKVTIDIDCEPLLSAPLNGPFIEQALINLLDNAIKYNIRHGRVAISSKRAGQELQISVLDQGQGIAPANIERIFERFYTVEAMGTGLGLAIVKHIASAHGGRVSVTSTPRLGSEFTLHLPFSS